MRSLLRDTDCYSANSIDTALHVMNAMVTESLVTLDWYKFKSREVFVSDSPKWR